MGDHLVDHSDSLPPELKCAVVEYITTLDDRKALVLVSKAWADVVLPVLWERFTTDLTQSGNRQVERLAHPSSNILKHVRGIHLTRGFTGDSDHLPTLLAAMARGQLRKFTCTTSISLSTLNLLLLLHPNLEELHIPRGDIFASAFMSPWTRGCLTDLTGIVVAVGNFPSTALRRLWDECPRLARLELKRSASTGGFSVTAPNYQITEDAFSTGPPASKTLNESNSDRALNILKLYSLRIEDITLPKSLDSMFRRIDMLALRYLTLHAFDGSSDLLEAMALQYAKGHAGLKRLCISRLPAQTTDAFITNLFLFLNSFSGLEGLLVHCQDCRKLDVDGITRHGETLEVLSIVTGSIHRQEPHKCFDAADLHKISTSCTKIQELCLNLYEADQDRNESDIIGPQPGVCYAPNEFEQALTAIAGMPKLRVLRLTNPPNLRKAYNRRGELFHYFQQNLQNGLERYGYQARADGIMQYLGEHGSDLELLVFSPIEKLPKAAKTDPDKHGHVWPDYYYYRGRTTDHKGTDMAVARPLADWKKDYPYAVVLKDV